MKCKSNVCTFFLEAWNKGKDALRLFLLLALKML